jgi:serine/threonine-protein kinase
VLLAAAETEVRAEPAPAVPEQRRADPREHLAAVQARTGGKRGAIIAVIAVVAVLAAAALLWFLRPASKPGQRANPAAPATASKKPPASAGQPAGPATAAGTAPVGGTAPGAAPVPGATVQTSVSPADPGTGQTVEPTGTATPTPGRTPASSAPAPRTRTLSSSAGTVEATCSGGKAHLTSWTAKDPYHVESATPGPALTTGVVFAHGISRTRMTVSCLAGTPTAVVLPL